VVDDLGGADGPAQGGGAEGGMPWVGSLRGIEDELLACLVDHGCMVEQLGAGDPEVVQYALDRPRRFMNRAGLEVWPGWLGPGVACWAGSGPDGDSGGGQDAAGGADVGSDTRRWRWPGRWRSWRPGRSRAGRQCGLEVLARRGAGRRRCRGDCGWAPAAGARSGADLGVVSRRETGQGFAGLVHGGHDVGEVAGVGGEVLRRAVR
jgi:hypothetical protein